MATPGQNTEEGAPIPVPPLTIQCPGPGVESGHTRTTVAMGVTETFQSHHHQSFVSSGLAGFHSSGMVTMEPVSILGKGRQHLGVAAASSTSSARHTVKFSEPEEASCRARTPDSPRFNKPVISQEKFKYHENFKYRVHEGSTTSTHRSISSHSGFGSIPETATINVSESSNYRYAESSTSSSGKLVGTSYLCPDSPRSKTARSITRTPDRNSIIASMELKVPSFHDLTVPSSAGCSGTGGAGGLTPLLGPPESRGLTILSPHNPTPELHFASTFTVRTRKGKTIVLPKLRIPGFQSHSHDSIFFG
ncbi:hypothetical protein Pmani_036900 [Petrolisthes manimaculis]|uniref:Uncharacterized protein n=1 Tax=Petrolisthes manimaculis TaxID=1843537 RepID=A0AAE1TM84_9EUCA|nr:hypothetical protein Pmani_036900 [Petrolisthes manimaculis]